MCGEGFLFLQGSEAGGAAVVAGVQVVWVVVGAGGGGAAGGGGQGATGGQHTALEMERGENMWAIVMLRGSR